jgi:hypothetical protein
MEDIAHANERAIAFFVGQDRSVGKTVLVVFFWFLTSRAKIELVWVCRLPNFGSNAVNGCVTFKIRSLIEIVSLTDKMDWMINFSIV